MSMTSSSPGRLLAVVGCLALGLAGCAVEPASDTAREAPSPRAAERVKGSGTVNKPVELEKVLVRRIEPDDPIVGKFLSPAEREAAEQPVMIEVSTVEPFDPRPRSAMPVIVLNGRPLTNSWVDVEGRRLIRAVLPTVNALGRRNVVVVSWLGAEHETTSLEPLVFTLDDVVQ